MLAFLLYFLGFMAIGGEWFCSWQSAIWNGQGKAAMFVGCIMSVLVVLLIGEAPERPGHETCPPDRSR